MKKATAELHPVVRRFVEDAGRTTQSFGLGRVVGQPYAYLYFAQTPQNLNDLQRALGISKGSASTGVRQLIRWEAVRKVWIRGDRKDYFEANDGFGRILKRALADTVASRLESYTTLLDEADQHIDRLDDNGNGEHDHVRERVTHLRRFSERARNAWNNTLLQRLLR